LVRNFKRKDLIKKCIIWVAKFGDKVANEASLIRIDLLITLFASLNIKNKK
jgi:hypothetical protein